MSTNEIAAQGLSSWDIISLFIQLLLGLVAFFGALVGKNLTDAIQELRKTDKELADKFDKYVLKDDMAEVKSLISGVFNRMDDIKDAVSEKVSRDELYQAIKQLVDQRK